MLNFQYRVFDINLAEKTNDKIALYICQAMLSNNIMLIVFLSVLVGSTNFVNGETCRIRELAYHLDLVKCPLAKFPATK